MSTVVVERSQFVDNVALKSGGALAVLVSNATVTQTAFRDNVAGSGGALLGRVEERWKRNVGRHMQRISAGIKATQRQNCALMLRGTSLERTVQARERLVFSGRNFEGAGAG